MSSNILSIGKSGLLAAQVGLSTTGQNIANANVPGYSRQLAVQTTSPTQNMGFGYVGSGTQVAQIKRYSDSFLTAQVNAAQSSTSASQAFSTQISQVDNLLADPTAGLSPAMQDFFNGVQDVSASPASAASRQAMLSAGDALANRFQTLSGRLTEIADGVNTQIASNVTLINSYATQIAKLNDSIASLGTSAGAPNDLLDQRDLLVSQLNQQVKATVVPGDNNSLNISIGSGQPLVVGNQSYQLAVTNSPTDLSRVEVGFVTGGKVAPLPESTFSGGGELGGLFDVRANALDPAQNALGRIATAMAISFNDQHKLGQDQNGAAGGNFFSVAPVAVTSDVNNDPSSTTTLAAVVSDPTQLTASDYKLKYDGSNFVLTRQSDGKQTAIQPYPQTVPQRIDGVDYTVSGSAAAGDDFLVRPTQNGASGIGMALTDTTKIAAAAPVVTATLGTNKGSGSISPGTVDSNYRTPGNALTAPLTLTYDKASNALAGFPAGQSITVSIAGAAPVVYPAGTASVPYSAGATLSFGGISVALSGAPADQDQFTVGPNQSGVGDSRNALLLANLQTKNILDGGSASYQGAYSGLVSFVGNSTRESQVNGLASATLLAQTQTAQQSVSGVNLDEEAANLLKYQQAYQAAGKVMQIASEMFATLLTIGG